MDELLDIGVDQLVFHVESETHVDRRIRQIRAAGARPGVALKPATPLSALDYILDECDAVLLMLINPGYAGSSAEGQVPYAGRKVRELAEMIQRRGLRTRIILDGRISVDNIRDYGLTGLANIFVCGSTCMDRNNLENSMRALNELTAGRNER